MQDDYNPATPATVNQDSGLAITSMICGISSIFLCLGLLTGIPAIICGHIARGKANSGDGLTEDTLSYVYFGGFTEADSVDTPLAFDKPGNHERYMNILFLDGHVKGYPGNFNTCSDVVEFLISNGDFDTSEKTKLREKAAAADSR